MVFLLLSFVTVLAQEHSTSPAAGDDGNWISVAPANAGFNLRMPGKPTVRVDPVEGSPGVENHMFMLETPAVGYVFSYVQFPADVTDAASIKGMLDAGREGALATSGAKLKGEREIRLNEHYGREWLLELPGGLTATNHAFWVKRRLYQLVVVLAPSANETPEALRIRQESTNKFFRSFSLVGDVGN